MDFRYMQTENGESPKVPAITTATGKDHNDVHYLYRIRKATRLVVGEKNMSGFTEDNLRNIHEQIVRTMTKSGISHWYDTWDSDLDDSLPMDLKLISSGFEPPKDTSIFDLEADERAIRSLLEEEDSLVLWSAPTARK